jgi:diamine N-acetyltransferase
MAIRLEPVTDANRAAVCAVEVRADQRRFLATPSIAEFLDAAPDHPSYACYALVEAEAVVGFVSFGYEPEQPSRRWVPLLIIDRRHQGRGHGRSAMSAMIELARAAVPAVEAIGLSYRPGNDVAARLYRGLGFAPAGEDEKGEVVAWLRLDSPSR